MIKQIQKAEYDIFNTNLNFHHHYPQDLYKRLHYLQQRPSLTNTDRYQTFHNIYLDNTLDTIIFALDCKIYVG